MAIAACAEFARACAWRISLWASASASSRAFVTAIVFSALAAVTASLANAAASAEEETISLNLCISRSAAVVAASASITACFALAASFLASSASRFAFVVSAFAASSFFSASIHFRRSVVT